MLQEASAPHILIRGPGKKLYLVYNIAYSDLVIFNLDIHSLVEKSVPVTSRLVYPILNLHKLKFFLNPFLSLLAFLYRIVALTFVHLLVNLMK